MALTAVIPNVFYADVDVGITSFCAAPGFRNAYRSDDEALCIVRRDDACFHPCLDAEVAKQDRPEFPIEQPIERGA